MASVTSDPDAGQVHVGRYRFSPEELRALQECNRESFYYRSLPFAATAMFAVHMAVKRGILSSHPKWGSTLKLIGAGFVGWFIGKLSYQGKCAEKLMKLENSRLGEAARKRKYGRISGDQFTSLEQSSGTVDDTREPFDFRAPPSLDLYPDKTTPLSGLDSTYRPSVDDPNKLPETSGEAPPTQQYTSYEELRKKNRTQFSSWEHSDAPGYTQHSPRSSKQIPAQSTGDSKNLYGDIWDE